MAWDFCHIIKFNNLVKSHGVPKESKEVDFEIPLTPFFKVGKGAGLFRYR